MGVLYRKICLRGPSGLSSIPFVQACGTTPQGWQDHHFCARLQCRCLRSDWLLHSQDLASLGFAQITNPQEPQTMSPVLG